MGREAVWAALAVVIGGIGGLRLVALCVCGRAVRDVEVMWGGHFRYGVRQHLERGHTPAFCAGFLIFGS